MRDVLTLPSWLYCFLTYTAILTTDQPTKDKLPYAQLMILEASRHGHLGWLDYDRSFRQPPTLHCPGTHSPQHFTPQPSSEISRVNLVASSAPFVAGSITPGMNVPWRTFTRNPIHLHQRLRIQRQGCVTRGIEVPASIPAHARTTMFVLHALVQHLILLANAPKHQATRSSSRGDHSESLRKRIPLIS